MDRCETPRCGATATVTYLGSPLCDECRCEVLAAKWDGGMPTRAVMAFKMNHAEAWRTGSMPGYRKEGAA